ncbi:MAG: hypothetical protein IJL79_01645 [Candidatus Methanomethylophilaceae archaeon]|nr:hypothetical protein [Candidatus Methanomethylophilaceae archaeon]
MLLCFAFAWPFSIYKLYKTKSTKGKSILFSMVVMLGYVFGIANKLVSNDVNHVMFFYFLDLGLVLIDSMLYFRNLHYENKASMA